MTNFKTLRTVRQVAGASEAFTEPSLRWLIFHAEKNGLSKALVRVGRRVLIDTDRFDAWLDEKRGQ